MMHVVCYIQVGIDSSSIFSKDMLVVCHDITMLWIYLSSVSMWVKLLVKWDVVDVASESCKRRIFRVGVEGTLLWLDFSN